MNGRAVRWLLVWPLLWLWLWAGCGAAASGAAASGAAAPKPQPARAVGPEASRKTAPAPAAGVPGARPATAEERLMVAELAEAAERIRGLSFLRPVEVRIQDAAEMKRFVEEQLDEAELEVARSRYVLLGLLAPDVAVRPLLLDLMEEQLIGYYDPDRAELAIRSDVASHLSAPRSASGSLTLRAVILHELVHALQDQHFDLKARLEEERTTDATGAFDALVEGDATLAMVAYAAESAGLGLDALLAMPELLQQMLGSGMAASGAQLEKAPAIVREPLLFSYREGAVFVAELARQGGWPLVNRAHHDPPPSTGHILWPERQLSGQPVSRVDAELPPRYANPAVAVVEEDVLGPYELGLFLEHHGGQASWSRRWRSDHLWQLDIQGQRALVWTLVFADARSASRVGRLVAAQAVFGVRRRGTRLLVLRNVPEAWAEGLPAALGVR